MDVDSPREPGRLRRVTWPNAGASPFEPGAEVRRPEARRSERSLGYPRLRRRRPLQGLARRRARESRLRLLERLHADGVTLDELREAIEEDRLILLPAERVMVGPARYTGLEIAEMTGLEPEFLIASRRAHGLPVADPASASTPIWSSRARAPPGRFATRDSAKEDMLEVTRVLGRGLAPGCGGDARRRPEARAPPRRDRGGARATASPTPPSASHLSPAPMVDQMVRLHLRHVIHAEMLNVAEREAGVLPGAREVGVAFADLVGFTRLGEQVPPDELGQIALRLEGIAAAVVEPPVRIVKSLGDAVMLVCPETEPLVGTGLGARRGGERRGRGLPAAARRRGGRTRAEPRRRLVWPPGQPREPRHRHRVAEQRPRDRGGARARRRRLRLVLRRASAG